ncbi:major facilitator superfamily domain-containing protein [Aspergillus alliaceus]|uniref:major facilitator superfamily domain-containing protein n=1 Tax=Petromyces alliaceus TaxID=209559 RepID=UPI0012A67338|nr:major facilitator superfamily domain-containing protein [Aspergillus alliaceus]KAB8232380.1 major facilitator superfamily domain-containing protein [Aspergillus alliaceus]
MTIALFTDTFLTSFIVLILPYIIESRASSWLLAESAAVSVIVRIPLGHLADKSTSTRNWLLWALVIALLSSITIALGPSLSFLFLGRLIQALASSIMWVAGLTTVTQNVQIQHIGMVYAIVSMAIGAGTSAGPMLSGVLFQLASYWAAWSSAFAVIAADIAFRLLMLENPRPNENCVLMSYYAEATTGDSCPHGSSDSERVPFLRDKDDDSTTMSDKPAPPSFYRCVFSKPNFVGGVYSSFIFGLLLTAFNATLPLHVREVFHSGGMPSGLLFAALQAPRIVMAPLVGWLKDRVGTRFPTVFAFVGLTPLILFLGVPGNEQFAVANTSQRGQVMYVVLMIFIGFEFAFLNNAGAIEAMMTVTRALAMVSVAWTMGTCVGPISAGALNETFGYFVLNCVVATQGHWVVSDFQDSLD